MSVVFFFSSRRRHTRCLSDWSSDVCSSDLPQFTYLPFNGPTTLAGLPTKIALDTKSVYLIDTAHYNDLVIPNGGVRFYDYNIKVSGFGTGGGFPNNFNSQGKHYWLPNFNLG